MEMLVNSRVKGGAEYKLWDGYLSTRLGVCPNRDSSFKLMLKSWDSSAIIPANWASKHSTGYCAWRCIFCSGSIYNFCVRQRQCADETRETAYVESWKRIDCCAWKGSCGSLFKLLLYQSYRVKFFSCGWNCFCLDCNSRVI